MGRPQQVQIHDLAHCALVAKLYADRVSNTLMVGKFHTVFLHFPPHLFPFVALQNQWNPPFKVSRRAQSLDNQVGLSDGKACCVGAIDEEEHQCRFKHEQLRVLVAANRYDASRHRSA